MKIVQHICLFCALTCMQGFADTMIFSNGNSVSGTIVQTNGNVVLLLAENAAFNYAKSDLKEIKAEPAQATPPVAGERLPNFQNTILLLSKQPWATNLTPIPATVIDNGVLKNVPYSSFHCGEDYEVNVYGDPEHPAGIEIGMYRKLLDNPDAKTNCLKFISDVLTDVADKDFLWSLKTSSDYKLRDDFTFEITQPSEADAYGGWWISVYSESQLNRARATDAEMKQISVSKADISKQSNGTNNLNATRPSQPKIIPFFAKDGIEVTNAEVVRVVDGVSLIYRTGPTSIGMVRLEDLPQNLRNQFGYDPEKTAAADELAARQKTYWQQQMLAAQQTQAQQAQAGAYAAQYASPEIYPGDYSSGGYYGGYSSGRQSSGGGSVYVRGYYRQNGTYVHSYYRH